MYVGREMMRTQLKVQHFKYLKLTFDKCGSKDTLKLRDRSYYDSG
jgi:hypothetical protein